MTDEAVQRTACVLCECNCGITVAVRDRTGTPWHKHIPARLDTIPPTG